MHTYEIRTSQDVGLPTFRYILSVNGKDVASFGYFSSELAAAREGLKFAADYVGIRLAAQ